MSRPTMFKKIYFNQLLIIFIELFRRTVVHGFSCDQPAIEIDVSPLVSMNEIHALELSWYNIDYEDGDWVALYDEDPFDNENPSPIFETTIDSDQQYAETGVQENRDYELKYDKPVCFGYWVVYWRESEGKNESVVSSCRWTHPTWMQNLREKIKWMPLYDLFIPGTHDSGSYRVHDNPFYEMPVDAHSIAQAEDIRTQLILGIRYLDFRIGLNNGKYYIHHDVIKIREFEPVLEQVMEFIDNTEEIVIIDFHRFPVGFKTNDDHMGFASYLIDKLGDHYLSKNIIGWDERLIDIWDSGKRLIVSYNNEFISNEKSYYFWPVIPQVWANAQDTDTLKETLDEEMSKDPDELWAAMAELTESFPGTFPGLRRLAYKVSMDVTNWFRGDWGQQCNIVAVDYFRCTGIVEAAIVWNKCRGDEWY